MFNYIAALSVRLHSWRFHKTSPLLMNLTALDERALRNKNRIVTATFKSSVSILHEQDHYSETSTRLTFPQLCSQSTVANRAATLLHYPRCTGAKP